MTVDRFGSEMTLLDAPTASTETSPFRFSDEEIFPTIGFADGEDEDDELDDDDDEDDDFDDDEFDDKEEDEDLDDDDDDDLDDDGGDDDH